MRRERSCSAYPSRPLPDDDTAHEADYARSSVLHAGLLRRGEAASWSSFFDELGQLAVDLLHLGLAGHAHRLHHARLHAVQALRSSAPTCVALLPSSFTAGSPAAYSPGLICPSSFSTSLRRALRCGPPACLSTFSASLLQALEALLRALELPLHERLQVPRLAVAVAMLFVSCVAMFGCLPVCAC